MPPPSPPPAAPRASPAPAAPVVDAPVKAMLASLEKAEEALGCLGGGGAASTNSNTATSRGGGALDALETIAHADQDRWKFKAAPVKAMLASLEKAEEALGCLGGGGAAVLDWAVKLAAENRALRSPARLCRRPRRRLPLRVRVLPTRLPATLLPRDRLVRPTL
jgi:hypothetical protein